MNPFFTSLKEVWSRLSWLDIVCSAIVVMGLLVELFDHNGRNRRRLSVRQAC